jgi:hypothetical protein
VNTRLGQNREYPFQIYIDMDNLKRLFQRNDVLQLELSTADCLPGRLLKAHYYWQFGDFGRETRLDDERGWASDVLGIPMLRLSPRQPTNLFKDNVTDQFSISAGVGLPQFGLTATGSIQPGFVVTWTISDVKSSATPDAGKGLKKFLQPCNFLRAWIVLLVQMK